MSAFMERIRNIFRRKKPPEPEQIIDEEHAEVGLFLSDIDGDEHTTDVLARRIGIRLDLQEDGDEGGKEAA